MSRSSHLNSAPDALPASAQLEIAATQYRADMQSRLMRLLPVIFVVIVALTALDDTTGMWPKAMQIAACVVMAVSYLLRKRISIFKSAVLIVASLYLQAICVASTQGAVLTCAFAIALALIVMQMAAGAARRWLRALTCVASYLGVALVVLTYATDSPFLSLQKPTADQAALLPWMLMSVSFVYFAFIVLVESEKMLQQIQSAGRDYCSSNKIRNDLLIASNDDSLPKCNSTTYDTLSRHNRTLQAHNRDLETFMYAISHDLRAPLRAIDGYSQLLAEDVQQPLNPAAARDLAGIRASIEKMQQMLSSWLRLAQREETDVRRQRVDVTALAETQIAELRIAEPNRSVGCVIAANMVIDADPILVTELLQNLLGNAWKFTQLNRQSAFIEVGTQMDGDEQVFFVRDNGAGFNAADADKLFRPFKRLHHASDFEGSGVGLAIARRIVERHQGRIWARGREGRGATFLFTLQHAASIGSIATTSAADGP